MSGIDKAKNRLRSVPRDYTYSEAQTLLKHLGFKEFSKGKTSGSRVCFYREIDNASILLHKPHPRNEMSVSSTRDLCEKLRDLGDL